MEAGSICYSRCWRSFLVLFFAILVCVMRVVVVPTPAVRQDAKQGNLYIENALEDTRLSYFRGQGQRSLPAQRS